VTRFSKNTKKAFSTRSKLDIAKQLDQNYSSTETESAETKADKDLVLDKEEYEMLKVGVLREVVLILIAVFIFAGIRLNI
jgi:hypothetical protein